VQPLLGLGKIADALEEPSQPIGGAVRIDAAALKEQARGQKIDRVFVLVRVCPGPEQRRRLHGVAFIEALLDGAQIRVL